MAVGISMAVATLIGAGLGTGAQVYGAKRASGAAKDAASAQERSTEAELEYLREQDRLEQERWEAEQARLQELEQQRRREWQQQQQFLRRQWQAEQRRMAPYRRIGRQAMSTLAGMLGLRVPPGGFGGGGGGGFPGGGGGFDGGGAPPMDPVAGGVSPELMALAVTPGGPQEEMSMADLGDMTSRLAVPPSVRRYRDIEMEPPVTPSLEGPIYDDEGLAPPAPGPPPPPRARPYAVQYPVNPYRTMADLRY